MTIGMMWYDPAKMPLDAKLAKAVSFYAAKYGAQPNTIYIHPAALDEHTPLIAGIELRPSKQILPNHFWIGVSKEGA